MKKIHAVLVALALVAVGSWAESKYPLRDKEVIRKTLKFADPAKPGVLSLDNVWGAITVEGSAGTEVELTAQKTTRAESPDKLRQAKDEVKLDITEKANSLEIYVDGPFRCQLKDDCRGIKDRDLGYEVRYDFVLKVPRRIRLSLKTVTDGDILVRNIEGDFEVRNVNGRVELADVAGAGRAETVNGGVKVRFARNPTADCTFKTINGDLDLIFGEGLSADLKLKTFNGEAFSDFATKPLPSSVEVQQKKEGRFYYHRDRSTQVRAGRGGPALVCDTFNGDIFIRQNAAR